MIKLKIKYGNESTDIRFPCKETEMSAALERIHAEDVTPLELYVTEVVFPEELGCLQDRFVNLDEVNFLGKRMDGFFGDEEYQFYEAMKSEGFDTLPDLINLSFNLDRYPLIRDISDMGKIGREYLLTVKGCLPADDEDDPKYAKLGRELIRSGKGVFTEHGLLFVNENTPFQKLYDGQVFPPYVYDSDVLCIAMDEVINAVRQMTQDAGPVKAVFFCPLVGNIDEGDGEMFTVGDSYLADSANEIAEALKEYTANDENDMAAYYNEDDGVNEKLTSAVWSVELHGDKLFGRIDCSLKEALTAEETEALRDWLTGQCSDGYAKQSNMLKRKG